MVRSHLMPLVIAGATGSGKSSLAFEYASRPQGEIICADSRQFYQLMRIGTAGPSDDEMAQIPHHGFHHIDPRIKKVDAGYFVDFTRAKVKEIQARGKRPIIVGGTGLYLRALRYGLSDVPKSDPLLVAHLEARCDNEGLPVLYRELEEIDPESTTIIKSHDRYRIVRALEIYHTTKQAPSIIRQSFSQQTTQFEAEWLLKTCPREEHAERLYKRVESMFEQGLVEEALRLRDEVGGNNWAVTVMGYYEALLYADNQLSRSEAIERVFIRHRQYARQQHKWFKKETFYTVVE